MESYGHSALSCSLLFRQKTQCLADAPPTQKRRNNAEI